MDQDIIPIILCGGFGSRLWPLSREDKPKQFSKLFSDKSLLEETILRSKLINNKCIIIGSSKNKKLIKNTCKGIKDVIFYFIFEEVAKNTTAAIFMGAKKALEINEKSKILILSSDHYISNKVLFVKTIKKAKVFSNKYNWILFGVKPTFPATGYGYIKTNELDECMEISEFIEKPKLSIASEIYKKQGIFWNSGIFFGNASKILKSINIYSKEIFIPCDNIWNNRKNESELLIKKDDSKNVISKSIDYSVIEKEESLGLIELAEVEWSDLGTWDSVCKLIDKEKSTKTKVFSINSKNITVTNSNTIIATIGINNLIISQFSDCLLLIKKGMSERVKELIPKLKENRHYKVLKEQKNEEKKGKFIKYFIQSKRTLTIKSQGKKFYFFVNKNQITVKTNKQIIEKFKGESFSFKCNEDIMLKNNTINETEIILFKLQ